MEHKVIPDDSFDKMLAELAAQLGDKDWRDITLGKQWPFDVSEIQNAHQFLVRLRQLGLISPKDVSLLKDCLKNRREDLLPIIAGEGRHSPKGFPNFDFFAFY